MDERQRRLLCRLLDFADHPSSPATEAATARARAERLLSALGYESVGYGDKRSFVTCRRYESPPPRPFVTDEERFPREDGRPFVTAVSRQARCRYCQETIPVRSTGVPRTFCRPACRVAWHRARRAQEGGR